MTIYEIIKKGLEVSDKFELLYKRDIFNKAIVVKYLYVSEEAKLNHIQEMKEKDWIVINEETKTIKLNDYDYDKEVEYPVAEFIQEYVPMLTT